MTRPISRNRLLESLKEAASWPRADRNTVVTLATVTGQRLRRGIGRVPL